MDDRDINIIRNKFNRAAPTYDQHCQIQNTICQQAIKLLSSRQNQFGDIADFACGTGESTLTLTQQVSFNKCYGIDFSEKLLAIAKNKLAHIKKVDWIHSDFDNKIYMDNSLDLIFCNMGLHWSNGFSTTISLWKQYLDNNGLLLFSIPLAENFPEIKKTHKPILLDHQNIVSILHTIGLKLLESKICFFYINFNNQIDILKYLKRTGTNYNKKNMKKKKGLASIKPDQIFQNPNNNKLTFKIGIYLLRKS